MYLPDLIWTSNTLEEEAFEKNEIFHKRPFLFGEDGDSSDDDIVESSSHENPFCESPYIFQKHRPVNFESKAAPSSTKSLLYRTISPVSTSHNWSHKSFVMQKHNSLIRSAPTPHGCLLWDASDNGERITLPILGCGRSDSIKRISPVVLSSLVTGTIQRKFVIVDARFRYEYEGGHVRGALNFCSENDLMRALENMQSSACIIIFYCEFSSVRGPTLARKFRNVDRSLNNYPILKFPEIYILEGGYKRFFETYSELCVPISYIQMHDKRFRKECVEYHKKIKKH